MDYWSCNKSPGNKQRKTELLPADQPTEKIQFSILVLCFFADSLWCPGWQTAGWGLYQNMMANTFHCTEADTAGHIYRIIEQIIFANLPPVTWGSLFCTASTGSSQCMFVELIGFFGGFSLKSSCKLTHSSLNMV